MSADNIVDETQTTAPSFASCLQKVNENKDLAKDSEIECNTDSFDDCGNL